jgi:phosphoribosyl 1,2-cyclic phosphate phosphodiesterase
MDAHTKEHVYNRFEYCFEMPEGRVHPPILELQNLIKGGDKFEVEGPGGKLSVGVIELSHGPTPSLGFILDGTVAYTPDVWDVPPDSFKALDGIDTWILDALRYNDHPTHAHADKALSWFAKTNTRQGVLTNLHIDMDYQTLKAELFGNVVPAYDGMDIRV